MTLIDKINQDFKDAMKSKNSVKKLLCQMLKSKFAERKKYINTKTFGVFDDREVIIIIQKELKECNEEIESAIKAKRDDLLTGLNYKKQLLIEYLPEQMSEKELLQEIIHCTAIITSELSNKYRKEIVEYVLLLHPGKTTSKRINLILNKILKK